MSLKRDNFNNLDKRYMKLAINLAVNQKPLTGINPSVGCVIVKEKKIISFGTTELNGRPHAEVVTLNKNKKNNYKSTVYTTLEPCTHTGKTPPCTSALIKSKIKKVYYSIEDFDSRTYKKAKKILNFNKILTKKGLLKKEANNLYKSYNFVKIKKLPYVLGKLATSKNFYINKKKYLITNQFSRNVAHLLRYQNQGILTTYKTINSDNPKLNCRVPGLERFSPKILILDKDLKIKNSSYIVKNSKNIKTFIFHNSQSLKKIRRLRKKGLRLIKIKTESNNYFNLKEVFSRIYKIGIHRLMVECGKELTNRILFDKLFNEFYLFIGNKTLNNKANINVSDIKKKLNINFKNQKYVNTYLDRDVLIHYY